MTKRRKKRRYRNVMQEFAEDQREFHEAEFTDAELRQRSAGGDWIAHSRTSGLEIGRRS